MANIIMILATIFFIGSLMFAFIAYVYVSKSKKAVVKNVITDSHVTYTFKAQSFDFEGLEVHHGTIGSFRKLQQAKAQVNDRPLKARSFNRSIETTLAFETEYA